MHNHSVLVRLIIQLFFPFHQNDSLSFKKVIFVAGLLIGSFLFSESWPNWLGPNHSGALEEGKISMPSKDQEYPRLWIKQVGEGWSAPVISGDKVILHDRFKANERIICLKLQSGEILWTFTQQVYF